MVDVTSTTQLSTFSILRGILLSNSTISSKFRISDFYEFEPSLKDAKVSLPYMVISLPTGDSETLTTADSYKEFSIDISLICDWEARDNFTNYANAVVSSLDSARSTLKASGYYDSEVSLIDSGTEERQSKKLVTASFRLSMYGVVRR